MNIISRIVPTVQCITETTENEGTPCSKDSTLFKRPTDIV